MKITISLKDVEKLVADLKRIPKNSSRRALGKAAKAGAKPIETSAKKHAPVDTGKLESSIRSKFAYQSSNRATVHIGSNMKPQGKSRHSYDYYQEFGTSFHPAQPFMRPAVDEQKDKAVDETRKELEKAVLEEVKRLGR
jgi:HK97 gp10 family phage protein